MKILFKTNSHLFFLLIFIVVISQYLLLGPVLKYGLTPDDWGMLFFYKTLGANPLAKIVYVWSVKGAYTTGPIYFIGILNDFFGLNYQSYQVANIILKILATLSLYPLILLVFKNRLLAFLTVFLYGISYISSRSLEYVVKGTDYLAIFLMNIFLIIYYYIISKRIKSWRWFIAMCFFWFVSLMISPIRIYPILVLIPLIEVFLWLQQRSVSNVTQSVKRLLILYLPFLIIYLYKPSAILAFLQNPPVIYQAIATGNWHLLLTPFQGMGLTLLTNGFWSNLINNLSITGIGEYLLFLARGPLVVFGFFILILAILKSQKPARFFLHAFSLNFLLDIFFYYIAIHELSIAENLRLHFDPARMYPILTSGFMLAISFASFLEWRDLGKRDNLLLALWTSSPIALLYTFLIWFLAPFGVGFEGQQGYYLVVPAISASLFLAAILAVVYNKAIKIKRSFSKLVVVCGIIVSLFYVYSLNRNDIQYFFNGAGINGRYAADQEKMYGQLVTHLKGDFRKGESILFYFDAFEDGARGTFYTETLLLNLANRLHIERGGINGCIAVFYQDLPSLEKLVVVKNNVKGFIYKSQCGEEFFSINNFYAFKLKNDQLTEIKQEVLQKLGYEKY